VVSVDSLTPYAQNPRTHAKAQIEQIRRSIREFGFTNPLLIDEAGQVIAGHGRLLAAKAEGLTELPAIVVAGLTLEQQKALVIADNQLAVNAGWDFDLLASELSSLNEAGFDLSLVGFTEAELAGFLEPRTDGLTDPDDAPEAPTVAVSVLGDLWMLGRHRIICGDATVETDVSRVLGDVRPHLMVTDPPWGVSYDPNWRNEADRANGKPYGDRAVRVVKNDDRADWSDAYALFPGEVAYVWHPGNAKSIEFFNSLTACGFEIRTQIIWAKSHFPIGRGHYHVQHEACWYAVRKQSGATGHWQGDRKQTTLWEIDKPRKSETGHSTQKPVECMKRPIENNSSPGQAIYEPFSGSGTTIIACEMTGRHCYAIELNPAYIDVAVERWEKFTGKTAILESTGQTFADVKDERHATAAA
jgi:DNA modification methylase